MNERDQNYHAYLLKHRVYCEHPSRCYEYATAVRNCNGQDFVFCPMHTSRIDHCRAVREHHDSTATH